MVRGSALIRTIMDSIITLPAITTGAIGRMIIITISIIPVSPHGDTTIIILAISGAITTTVTLVVAISMPKADAMLIEEHPADIHAMRYHAIGTDGMSTETPASDPLRLGRSPDTMVEVLAERSQEM